MKKFYYLGVIRFKEVSTSDNRTCRQQFVAWGKPYASAEECLAANQSYITKHLGEHFVIQGFERKLDIQADGSASKFVEEA